MEDNLGKTLPLNPFSDRIVAIKLINREEHQEYHDELQAAISPSILPPNLDFNPSVDAEMKEEEDEIKRNEWNGV